MSSLNPTFFILKLTEDFLVVSLEFLDTLSGQRMFNHGGDNTVWNSSDISTSQSTLGYMNWVTYGSADDLSLDVVDGKHLRDGTD